MKKKLKCQVPIVKDVAPKCDKDAVCYDYYGFTYCEEHNPGGTYKLSICKFGNRKN
jgi:hypothetical protein